MHARILLFAAIFAVSGAGCAAARVRSEAAIELRCPEINVSLTQASTPGDWTAKGCGRAAICRLPEDVDRADVQCVGGGNAQSDVVSAR